MKRLLGRAFALRRLRLGVDGYGKTDDSAGDGDRGDPRARAPHRASHRHLVPFVMRQPATSNYVYTCPIMSSAREWCYGMKYPPNSRYS